MTQLEKEQSLIENIKNYKLFLIVCLAFFATLFFYQTTKLTYEQYEPAFPLINKENFLIALLIYFFFSTVLLVKAHSNLSKKYNND